MRILLVDDHKLVRDVFMEYLQTALEIEVCTANTLEDACALVEDLGPFACILADLRMPGVRSAFDLRALVDANAPKPVMLFSGAATFSDLFAAKRIGMVGFVRKDMPAPEVLDIVSRLLANPADVSHQADLMRHMKIPRFIPDRLSEEDCLILGMLANGARNSEISASLGVSRSRVENRLRRIYKTIGVSSRLGAANFVNAKAV